jgi:maltose alpha-D-glucosyltransferase / alpha-amylase
VKRYYEKLLAHKSTMPDIPIIAAILDFEKFSLPESLSEFISNAFLDQVRLLAKRTGEFHNALTKDKENSDFSPEKFNYYGHIELSQSMVSYANRVFIAASKIQNLKEGVKKELNGLLKERNSVMAHFKALGKTRINSIRARTHGDYHLGQVLFTGNDFIIIDFEGEPARSLTERRLKKSPLRDVAGMLRSFHYAAYMGLLSQSSVKPEDTEFLERWVGVWYRCCSETFLKSYVDTVSGTDIVPKDKRVFNSLLNAFLLEKAVYELSYEMNNRPDWSIIPIKGIEDLIGTADEEHEKK